MAFRLENRVPPPIVGACIAALMYGAAQIFPDLDFEMPWRLTVRAQSLRRPRQIIDAEALVQVGGAAEGSILPRPFQNAIEQVRSDLARAARYAPVLEPLGRRDGPLSCALSLQEAYVFLRDAAAMVPRRMTLQ